jgi:DNA repair protein RecO (recombination protein O)
MRERKTEAVILDTTDIFDADRSLLLFTREFGRLRARARGVRKPTSRLTGHLLHYIPTQLELVENGEWYLVVQAQIVSHYAAAETYPKDALLFSEQAALLAETMNRLFQDHDPHPAIYDGLVYTLDRLRDLCDTENRRKAELGVAEFVFKCLAELGYRPELFHCAATDADLTEDYIGWSSRVGGLLSREGYQMAEDAFRLSSPKVAVALRQLLRAEFMAERLGMDEEVQAEAVRIIYHYAQTQMGQPLRSLRG